MYWEYAMTLLLLFLGALVITLSLTMMLYPFYRGYRHNTL